MIIEWVMFILEVLGQVIAEEQTNLSLHCSFSGLGLLVHIECVEYIGDVGGNCGGGVDASEGEVGELEADIVEES